MGNARLWSIHYSSSLLLAPLHTFPLLARGSSTQTVALQDTSASAWTLNRRQFFQEIITCSGWGPPWVEVWIACLCQEWFPQAAGEHSIPPWSLTWAARESLLQRLEHLLSLLFWTLRSQDCFSLSSCSLCLGMFCPSLNTFSRKCHHLGWGAQLCLTLGPLEPAGVFHLVWGSPWSLLTEAAFQLPPSPHPPTPWHLHLMVIIRFQWLKRVCIKLS